MPRIDRRPVWLGRELRQCVEEQLGLALRETQTTEDPGRARVLRRFVLPHYLAVLEDHRRSDRIRARGGSGYRELTGTFEQQLARVSRIPCGALRSPGRPKRPLYLRET
ncbi:MAG: hypothetical protein CMN30_02910 [Sandaracinus sp.]|nr:hypothetical protein [Sandaracinus sp.]|tara:strand:+ start:399 stop:725 length:327 start_codon:yes stop_codon:yes gene_type:complete